MMTKDEFWQEFIEKTGKPDTTQYFESCYFHVTEEWANKLLALVLEGKKKATSSSLWAYEKEGSLIPKVGDFSIVTDWEGNPHCVIETTAVTILPFNEITFEICGREGEDDNLASWQRGHRHFFTEEGKMLGYEFSETMPVIFEDFKVVYAK